MICCFKGKYRVTSPRGYRTLFGKKEFHKGIDLVGLDDTTVYSISDGTVRTAYQAGGAGNYVVVTNADGKRVFYMHLASFKVKTGDKVTKGQALGVMGATGNVTGAHTHLEIRPAGTTGESLDICAYTQIPNKVGVYTYNPAPCLEDDLKVLEAKGLINTPAYWKNNARKYLYVPELIHNMAEYLRK